MEKEDRTCRKILFLDVLQVPTGTQAELPGFHGFRSLSLQATSSLVHLHLVSPHLMIMQVFLPPDPSFLVPTAQGDSHRSPGWFWFSWAVVHCSSPLCCYILQGKSNDQYNGPSSCSNQAHTSAALPVPGGWRAGRWEDT